MLNGKNILVTGGTGSFGRAFVKTVMTRYKPRRLVILSRDELKQWEMQRSLPEEWQSSMRFFIGDIRDRQRLNRALDGVDCVVHAAALKQVPACERDPIEAIKTNVQGTANLVEAALDRGVGHFVALSTDKAVNPLNLYGATKMCADKLVITAKTYTGGRAQKFSVVRYGNVAGSRGSVIPVLQREASRGRVPITHPDMTRFFLTVQTGVDFVLSCLGRMEGGEIFVPKVPSARITELADVIAPGVEQDIIGVRPGEKIHEVLISEDEARYCLEFDDHFAMYLTKSREEITELAKAKGGQLKDGDFQYSSSDNPDWLTPEAIAALVEATSKMDGYL